MNGPTRERAEELITNAQRKQIVVVGDVMLDEFIWGDVSRISPEAPVPVLLYERESVMPGGAANVARNLRALNIPTRLYSIVGRDPAAERLATNLERQGVDCRGFLTDPRRQTSIKTRIVAQRQQIVRVDRETREEIDRTTADRLLNRLERELKRSAAVIVGDYGKGVITQYLLDRLSQVCRERGIWLSLDPKPFHRLSLKGLSLITPNRKEAFELAGEKDSLRAENPLDDEILMRVVRRLFRTLKPNLLLVTLGDQGMVLCSRGKKPFHIPTIAQEVFDVSGAGDTVIASFTAAIAAGAGSREAAAVANHAGGIVVGKVGTATVNPEELLKSFDRIP